MCQCKKMDILTDKIGKPVVTLVLRWLGYQFTPGYLARNVLMENAAPHFLWDWLFRMFCKDDFLPT